MKTLHWIVDPAHLDTPEAVQALDRAAGILRSGGLVALPTETVYGLGANAFDEEAVKHIFAAKSRPKWDPVIVHIASLDMLEGLVEDIPPAAQKLMQACWPGPLTLLLKRTRAVPDVVTAGRPLAGIRMPSHPVALELIRRAGVPVAAPSANLFSRTSPTTAAHVLADLDGRIDAILDAGPTRHGVESTVLDPATSPITIYRPGAVTLEQVCQIAGPAEIFRGGKELRETPAEALPSPGVGLRHYAPKARLVLVDGPIGEMTSLLAAEQSKWSGENVGVMLPAEVAAPPAIVPSRVYAWGRWSVPAELARRLFAGLRALDAAGCTVILCPWPPAAGIGAAMRDRLRKAAK